MALTLDDLYGSPDHYLHSFEGDTALFMPMDREAYHRSIFLDGRISPAAERVMRIPVGALTGRIPQAARTAWIFHIAHCGSTLLARALDRLTTNLVLREPLALRQVALQPEPNRIALVAAMISKRYAADLPTVVKANVPVNFLLGDLIKIDPEADAIFLYSHLRDYLLAILRSENHRTWLRSVTKQLGRYLGDLSSSSDAERAATLWLAQMRAYEKAVARMPNSRSLEAELFFAEPGRMLSFAADRLGVPMREEEVGEIVESSLFSTYAKNPDVKFDNDARLERRKTLESSLSAELDEAQSWVERNGGGPLAATSALMAVKLGS
jgi:hypothetical protein